MRFRILIRYSFTNERRSQAVRIIALPGLARSLLTLIGSCRIYYVFIIIIIIIIMMMMIITKIYTG